MNFHAKEIMQFTHLSIRVVNLARSKEYYENVIGLSVLEESDNQVVFTVDNHTPLLTIISPEGLKAKASDETGLYHFALLLPTRSDLANFLYALTTNGIPYGAANHLVSEALYLKDPDGNEIEIYIDKDFNDWKWLDSEVEMASLPLDYYDIIDEITTKTWTKLPSDTIMGHIHLFAHDLDPMLAFYQDGLGYKLVSRFGNQAMFLSKADYHHHIAFNTWKGTNTKNQSCDRAGLDYLTLSLKDDQAREDLISKLNAANYKTEHINDDYIVYDPEDNKIVIKINE